MERVEMSQSVRGTTFAEQSTSQQVIEAVAEKTGNDPTEVGPLYHVVDPDALDRLFAPTPGSGRSGGYVEFTFEGCDVVIRGSGEVEVTEREVTPGFAGDSESEAARAGSSDGV